MGCKWSNPVAAAGSSKPKRRAGRAFVGNESETGPSQRPGEAAGAAIRRASRAGQRMAAPRGFPLLVEGSWGPDPPKNLNIKLQMYFQSTKRSGGGECEVHPEPGNPPRFRVLFFPEDGEDLPGGPGEEPGWSGSSS